MRRPALVAVIALLALAGCGGGDDDGGGEGTTSGGSTTKPNTTAIELPASLGVYKDIVEASRAKAPSDPRIAQIQKRDANTRRLTTAAYSGAFGGAASAFRQYADAPLKRLPSVIAVRAEAPGITFGPVNDPNDLLLRNNLKEVRKVGEVECLITSLPTPRGQPLDPSTQQAIQCQRAESGVTVFVYGSGFEGPEGTAAMAKLTNDAFAAVT